MAPRGKPGPGLDGRPGLPDSGRGGVWGNHFGEIGLFYDEPRNATVIADSDLRCYALSAWDFRPFVEANPQVAWPIMETMAERLAENAAR